MLDSPFPDQLQRFGFAWDSVSGFGPHMEFWSFYQQIVAAAPPNSTIVEVGCYHGRSLICLGLLAREANKGLDIVGVDNNDMGANGCLHENLRASKLGIRLITKGSVEAAKEFANGSCWLVFIDAAHLHDAVEADVRAWMPKVSHWLAGHDFFMYTVHQPIAALFPTQLIYDERWQDIWIVPKCEPLAGADIRTWIPVMPPYTPEGWKP